MRIVSSYTGLNSPLGSLKLAIPFYQSEIVFLVGNINNLVYSSNKLTIWNDKILEMIASITFAEEIIDVLIDKCIFFVILKNKIILFETRRLNYICTLEDFNLNVNTNKYAICPIINLNIISLYFVSALNPHHIKINKFRFDNERKVSSKFQMNILIKDFKEIQYIDTDNRGQFILAVNESGTKIRVFSTNNYTCMYKFHRGKTEAKILKVSFDHDNRFMALVSSQNTIHFYKLKRNRRSISLNQESFIKNNSTIGSSNKASMTICTGCESEDEDPNENILKEMINDIVSIFKNKQYKESFAQYKTQLIKHKNSIYFFNDKKEFVKNILINIGMSRYFGGNVIY